MSDAAQNAMPVALACAVVGIVVGVVSVTGLGLKLDRTGWQADFLDDYRRAATSAR